MHGLTVLTAMRICGLVLASVRQAGDCGCLGMPLRSCFLLLPAAAAAAAAAGYALRRNKRFSLEFSNR